MFPVPVAPSPSKIELVETISELLATEALE